LDVGASRTVETSLTSLLEKSIRTPFELGTSLHGVTDDDYDRYTCSGAVCETVVIPLSVFVLGVQRSRFSHIYMKSLKNEIDFISCSILAKMEHHPGRLP
jgi:hypothetical protein